MFCKDIDSIAFVQSQEFFTAVSELWKDEGVRACYSRSSRCQLIDNAQ